MRPTINAIGRTSHLGSARELHNRCALDEALVVHFFSLLGPLLIVVGLAGSIRGLTGRSDHRF